MRMHLPAEAIRTACHKRRSDGLNGSVCNRPSRKKAADLQKLPTVCVQKNGKTNDKPNVPRTEHEDACCRQ